MPGWELVCVVRMPVLNGSGEQGLDEWQGPSNSRFTGRV